jgi:hypothetical protein
MRCENDRECLVGKDLKVSDCSLSQRQGIVKLLTGYLSAADCGVCVCVCFQSNIQIGSPMVCSGGVLAGVASFHNPNPVYTPIDDYISWIQSNRKIQDYADNEWK